MARRAQFRNDSIDCIGQLPPFWNDGTGSVIPPPPPGYGQAFWSSTSDRCRLMADQGSVGREGGGAVIGRGATGGASGLGRGGGEWWPFIVVRRGSCLCGLSWAGVYGWRVSWERYESGDLCNRYFSSVLLPTNASINNCFCIGYTGISSRGCYITCVKGTYVGWSDRAELLW